MKIRGGGGREFRSHSKFQRVGREEGGVDSGTGLLLYGAIFL